MSEFEIGIRSAMDREESKKTSDRMLAIRAREARAGVPRIAGRHPCVTPIPRSHAASEQRINATANRRTPRSRLAHGRTTNPVSRGFGSCRDLLHVLRSLDGELVDQEGDDLIAGHRRALRQ